MINHEFCDLIKPNSDIYCVGAMNMYRIDIKEGVLSALGDDMSALAAVRPDKSRRERRKQRDSTCTKE